MKFWLGTHRPQWLERTDVPLFVSRATLKDRRTFPRALGPWALDSGGFTALHKTGDYEITTAEWAREVRRYAEGIGNLAWAAPLDWMCEPSVLQKTGLTVREHQRRTVENFAELRQELGDIVIPVLQGWTLDDYHACWEMYTQAGAAVWADPLVGVGSICRRGQDTEISRIIREIHSWGVSIHAFGVRSQVLRDCAPVLASADSMAWSFDARHLKRPPAGLRCGHRTHTNCLPFALRWRERQLERINQLQLEVAA